MPEQEKVACSPATPKTNLMPITRSPSVCPILLFLGVEFASKKLDIDENYRIKLQIWDTAGQESFRSIVKSFYRNAAAVILVYNITKYQPSLYFSKESFESLRTWLDEAREHSPKNAIFVLMGTHLDLEDK